MKINKFLTFFFLLSLLLFLIGRNSNFLLTFTAVRVHARSQEKSIRTSSHVNHKIETDKKALRSSRSVAIHTDCVKFLFFLSFRLFFFSSSLPLLLLLLFVSHVCCSSAHRAPNKPNTHAVHAGVVCGPCECMGLSRYVVQIAVVSPIYTNTMEHNIAAIIVIIVNEFIERWDRLFQCWWRTRYFDTTTQRKIIDRSVGCYLARSITCTHAHTDGWLSDAGVNHV